MIYSFARDRTLFFVDKSLFSLLSSLFSLLSSLSFYLSWVNIDLVVFVIFHFVSSDRQRCSPTGLVVVLVVSSRLRLFFSRRFDFSTRPRSREQHSTDGTMSSLVEPTSIGISLGLSFVIRRQQIPSGQHGASAYTDALQWPGADRDMSVAECARVAVSMQIRRLFLFLANDREDIIDEAIKFFRANIFFRNYDIKVTATRPSLASSPLLVCSSRSARCRPHVDLFDLVHHRVSPTAAEGKTSVTGGAPATPCSCDV
jgi:hypothetical protein